MNCDDVRIAAMALGDGEQTRLSAPEVKAHLAACAACRREVEQLAALALRLDAQRRRRTEVDLWPAVQPRLQRPDRRPFFWLAIALFGYKLIEFVPRHDYGLWIQLVPVAIAWIVLRLLRQNPFEINTPSCGSKESES